MCMCARTTAQAGGRMHACMHACVCARVSECVCVCVCVCVLIHAFAQHKIITFIKASMVTQGAEAAWLRLMMGDFGVRSGWGNGMWSTEVA